MMYIKYCFDWVSFPGTRSLHEKLFNCQIYMTVHEIYEKMKMNKAMKKKRCSTHVYMYSIMTIFFIKMIVFRLRSNFITIYFFKK